MTQSADEQRTKIPVQHFGCLRCVSLFSKLSDEELSCFNNAAKSRSYKKGKILYIQEDPAEFFYIICSGWIKLFHTMPDGEEVVVDMLTNSDTVGESAIFEQGRHTSTAQVVEDVQLLSIPSNLLKEQIHFSNTLAFSMLSSMSKHHRRHYRAIALNAMQSAPQRIGCFLLKLCPAKQESGVSFNLPYDKTLIAYVLGMKSATFSRALNILRQKTNVRISGTYVEIDSVERLVKFVYGHLSSKYMPEKM